MKNGMTYMIIALALASMILPFADAQLYPIKGGIVVPPESNDWDTIYFYADNDSICEIKGNGQNLEVSRAYGVKNFFKNVYFATVNIKNSPDYDKSLPWAGPRLAIVNPSNLLERYEIRLYPVTDTLQVNYVDRTGRTGDMSYDEEHTISEVLVSTDCSIEPNHNYYTVIMKNGNKWKAFMTGGSRPTCFVTWEDDRIQNHKMVIGIQSAGKYIVSKFHKVFAI